MANSLYPAFVRIFYHSEFSPHTMTIPTRAWSIGDGDPVSGEFTTWDDGLIEGHTMIEALVDTLLPFFVPTISFDNYIIYTMADPEADPLPQYRSVLTGKVGTGDPDTDGWYAAVEATLVSETTAFGIMKLVLLDTSSFDDFSNITSLTSIPLVEAILDELQSSDNAWSGRDNARPNVFLQYSKTLNEKLRKSYRLT